MGKFSSYLLCSDWDRTMANENEIIEKNIKSIEYFMKNGGKFTICTGRILPYLQNLIEGKITPNTYIVTLNGAVIIDKENNILYEGFMDSNIVQIMDCLLEGREENFNWIKIYVPKKDEPIDLSPFEFKNWREYLKINPSYKIVIQGKDKFVTEEAMLNLNKKIDLKKLGYLSVRSWETGLEIIKEENCKGKAVRKIADAIGAKTLVCVGDYENDFTMIKEADIGYAVKNAHKSLKDIADRVTVDFRDGAIAEIIKDLEKDIKCKNL